MISVVAVMALGLGSATAAQADKVLLFGPSVSGGASSFEAQQAAAQGFGVDVVDASTWSSMTTAQFAAYRAIVIGDNADSTNPADLAAAENNASVWGAAVRGRVLVTGADPELHAGDGVTGAVTFINKVIAFAASAPGQTGAYIALPAYYGTGPGTSPAPVLDAFGGFTATHKNQDSIHIDPAIVPGPSGLSDGVLSGWTQTAHTWFTFPNSFRVWAIGVDPTGTYTTSDGQTGFPSFLVRQAFPEITSISPGSGSAAGGTAVTISGHDFSGGSVSFGGVPAASVTANSESQITAVSPHAHAVGPVDVSVTTTVGKTPAVAADRFTYEGCVVPKIKGKNLKRAKKKLKKGDCKLGKVKGPRDGKVKKQRPKPGTVRAPGSKVTVKLG
jgi:hypothetical protein